MARTIEGVERANDGHPLMEPRLSGTWRSDRKKTFEHVALKGTPEAQRKFRSLFGKLTIQWTRTKWKYWFEGKRSLGRFPNDQKPSSTSYTVLARSRDKAVLVLKNDPQIVARSFGLFAEEELVLIEFDDRGYWVTSPWMTFKEYFRKLPAKKRAP